ncbi:MAG: ABC transporter ATP-binding protein [Bacilli bacterium]|nr:ABC transporter ATP-binding protein [Bacilli bacterium]
MDKKLAIQLKNISKTFGKVKANSNVSLDLYEGEILSLLGENGSGKTSLMNVLAGIYTPDSGSILLNGEKITITSPKDAFSYRIGMIHQHFKLVDVFTATENVVVGLDNEDYKGFRRAAVQSEYEKFERIKAEGKEPTEDDVNNYKRLLKSTRGYNLKESAIRIKRICDKFGFVLDPNKRVCDMSVSEKQTLEIVKTLYRGVDILILDEPTAVLTPQEIDKLFDVLRNMREAGKSIIIITHKLNEVMEISDRITVLRKGELVGSVNKTETSIDELTEMMVGKKTELNIERSLPNGTQSLLEVKDLCVKNIVGTDILKNISFNLKEGEILGIAGISGNGQKELLEAIAGVDRISSGEVIYHRQKKDKPVSFYHKSLKEIKKLATEGAFHNKNNKRVSFEGKSNKEIKEMVNNGEVFFNDNETMSLKGKNPREIRELGIHLAFVPEDRLGMGLVGNMDINENMMLRSYRKGKGPFLNFKKPKDTAETIIHELEVATPSATTQVKKLSGGNVQKVLVGREIAYAPSVFMVAYPVRGLDINSSYTIYNLLNKQKEKGVGIIYVGEDLDVLLALADRILVLCNGEVSGIVDARKIDKRQLGALMLGNSL